MYIYISLSLYIYIYIYTYLYIYIYIYIYIYNTGSARATPPAMKIEEVQLGHFCEPGFRHLSAKLLWKFCAALPRFAETAIFPCRITNKYCGDLRRRRIRTKSAQTNVHILAPEFVCMNVCMYLCIYVSMYLCIYVSMYLCTYVPMYLCIYVSMYLCIYV